MTQNPRNISQMLFYSQGMADAHQEVVFVYEFPDKSLQTSTSQLKGPRLVTTIRPNSDITQ